MSAEQDQPVSYSRRVCRRCGAELQRTDRGRRGEGWSCPNGRHGAFGLLQS